MARKLRLGILGSGSGSNFASILMAIESGRLLAEIVLVISDNPNAYLLERAKKAGIPTNLINCDSYQNKFPEEAQIRVADLLKKADVDLVCLAGFMRLVKVPLLEAFPRRIINIHPSLLPEFPGLKAWKQAWKAEAKEVGCTIHRVDEGIDTGKILAQSTIQVSPEDTAETLHKKIQEQEHILYPKVIKGQIPYLL